MNKKLLENAKPAGGPNNTPESSDQPLNPQQSDQSSIDARIRRIQEGQANNGEVVQSAEQIAAELEKLGRTGNNTRKI